ncbi:uncharacterized protein PHALS_10519 [Plasmopara halstedii]|uniref:Uncharacterized protein n=1 Tax=Plasmopara halstedii TaxID=4781 RepID=A0A0P1AHC9_PLAHL|nr:uncharacterized protein PHALS_10519 [Plasmopara halstedii]CEG40311.1 hypothetical protein PHALS_10519 [Plasmopara halstedii]|eukprot:XP_024576680.1 hypothetical protein PHALS_10519 [Plasmopara halstedii]
MLMHPPMTSVTSMQESAVKPSAPKNRASPNLLERLDLPPTIARRSYPVTADAAGDAGLAKLSKSLP